MSSINRNTYIPLVGLAILALLAAIWAGLLRMGWQFPAIQPGLPRSHGPLMIPAFLGTLIAIERIVALKQKWMLISPVLSGLGGLLIILGTSQKLAPYLLFAGSLVLVMIFVVIIKRYTVTYTIIMGLGSASLAVGNLLWILDRPLPQIIYWWAGFLILTIAGERLELGSLMRHKKSVFQLFNLVIAIYIFGLITSIFDTNVGTRIIGLGTLLLGLWLLRFDIATKTVRQSGLPRFAALCLLSGYVWLVFGGILGMLWGYLLNGPFYDAILHSIFLGFTFSMIFGHSPIIFPSIFEKPVMFSNTFYIPLILLHLSLIIRMVGNLAGLSTIRMWGGLLNGVAIVVFFLNTGFSIFIKPRLQATKST